MSQSDESYDEKDDIINRQKREIKMLKSELQEKEESLEEYEEEVTKLKRDIKRMRRSVVNAKDDSDEDASQPDSLSGRIAVLEDEINNRNTRIDELVANIRDGEDTIIKMQDGNSVLEKKLDELLRENEHLIEMIEERKNSADNTVENLRAQIKDQLTDIKMKNDEIRLMSVTIEELKTSVADNSVVEQLREEVEAQSNEISQKDKENRKLLKKVSKLENRIEELTNEDNADSSTDSRHDKDLEKEKAIEELRNGLAEISSFTGSKIKTMTDCVQLFMAKCNELDRQKYDSITEDPRDSIGLKKYKRRILDQDNEIEELNNKLRDVEKRYRKKKKELIKTIKAKDEEIEEIKSEMENYDQRKRSMTEKKKVKKLEDQIEELEEELESLTEDLRKKDRKIKESEQEINDNSSEILDLTEQDKKKSQEIKILKDNIKQLESANEALLADTIDMKEKEKGTIQRLNDDNESLRKRAEALTTELSGVKQMIENKQGAIETMRGKITVNQKDLNDMRIQLTEAQEELDKCVRESIEQREIYHDQKKKIEELEEIIAEHGRLKGHSDPNRFFSGDNLRNSDQRYGKEIPNWWKEHQEEGELIENEYNKICPNCRTVFKEAEFKDHVVKCTA